MRMMRVAAAIALVVAVACGSTTAEIGPLEIDPPKGWLVTDRTTTSIKITNGTIGDDTATRAGTATAVFDIYVDAAQTADEFRDVLRENNVEMRTERLRIDGSDAELVSYERSSFGPAAEVVFIPDHRIRIVYRAAYADQPSAFARNRDDFRAALETISLSRRAREATMPSRGPSSVTSSAS